MRSLTTLVVFAALATSVSVARVAHADNSGDQVRSGMALAAEGRWDEALARFEEAHRLDPQPATLFNVAQARLKTRRFQAAGEAYRALLAARASLTPHQVEIAQQGLATAEASVARLTVTMSPAPPAAGSSSGASSKDDATITVDDARVSAWPVVLDPGEHVARVLREGRTIAERRLVLRAGSSSTIDLTPPAPSEAHPPPTGSSSSSSSHSSSSSSSSTPDTPILWPGIAVAAGSVVFLGFGSFFAIRGYGDWSRLHDGCGQTKTCDQGQVDDARRDVTIGDVGLGLGVVGAVIATYLLISPPLRRSAAFH